MSDEHKTFMTRLEEILEPTITPKEELAVMKMTIREELRYRLALLYAALIKLGYTASHSRGVVKVFALELGIAPPLGLR